MEAKAIRRRAAASLLGIPENNFRSFTFGADAELFQPNAESQDKNPGRRGPASKCSTAFVVLLHFSPSVAKVEVNKSHLDS